MSNWSCSNEHHLSRGQIPIECQTVQWHLAVYTSCLPDRLRAIAHFTSSGSLWNSAVYLALFSAMPLHMLSVLLPAASPFSIYFFKECLSLFVIKFLCIRLIFFWMKWLFSELIEVFHFKMLQMLKLLLKQLLLFQCLILFTQIHIRASANNNQLYGLQGWSRNNNNNNRSQYNYAGIFEPTYSSSSPIKVPVGK